MSLGLIRFADLASNVVNHSCSLARPDFLIFNSSCSLKSGSLFGRIDNPDANDLKYSPVPPQIMVFFS